MTVEEKDGSPEVGLKKGTALRTSGEIVGDGRTYVGELPYTLHRKSVDRATAPSALPVDEESREPSFRAPSTTTDFDLLGKGVGCPREQSVRRNGHREGGKVGLSSDPD